MENRTNYTEEQKLSVIKSFLESNLSITQFCNVNMVNYCTLKAWLNWYNEKKGAWQAAATNEGQITEEVKPSFKETGQRIDDGEFHQYRTIKIEFKSTRISCDKSAFKDVWRIING